MPETTKKAALNPFSLKGEFLPDILSFNQLAEMLKESIAEPKVVDIELQFKGFPSEGRPPIEPETILDHEFLDGKVKQVWGPYFNLLYSVHEKRLETYGLEFSTDKKIGEIYRKIKETLLKNPDDKPSFRNQYLTPENEFNELNHKRIATLAKFGIHMLYYKGVTPENLGKMTYDPRSVQSMFSPDKTCIYLTGEVPPKCLQLLERC